MSQDQKPRVAGRQSGRPAPELYGDRALPIWALGQTGAEQTMSERERKLTAAIYTQLPGVLAHVKKEGRLPPNMQPAGGAEIGLRILVQRRGIDIELSDDERAVFDAIGLAGKITAGCVVVRDP